MKETFADTLFFSLLSNLLDSHEEGVQDSGAVEPRDVADLAGVSERLALMHRILERSSAAGQP